MNLPPFFDGIMYRYRENRGGLKVRYLSDAVTKLSRMFTKQETRLKNYLDDPHLRAGYAYYYTPLNSVKVLWVLEELRTYDPGFLSKPLTALDYGAGCGAGMLGLMHAGIQGTATLFDPARDAQAESRFFADHYPQQKLQVEFARTVRDDERYDLILLSNVLSELPDTRPALKLLDFLNDPGYLIVIEPADQVNTTALQKFRDEAASKGHVLSAPCLSSAPCPMLRDNPRMWCCMEVPFNRPKFVSEVDSRAGFDRRSLKFSYLVFTKGGKTLGGLHRDNAWRLVGDIHRSKGKSCGTFCGKSGKLAEATLMSRDLNDQTRVFVRSRRGETLNMDLDGTSRVKMVERPQGLG